MKFEIVTRDKIDMDKWDHLILNSTNPRIYATSNYLDASTSSKWKAIIFSDYKAVIPIYEKKTATFKYLAQPILSQQLGLFITQDEFVDKNEYLGGIINYLFSRYNVANMSLNEGNWIPFSDGIQVVPRTNFLLDLGRNYEKIYSNYSRSLTRNLKKSSHLIFKRNNSSIDSILEFQYNNLNKKLSFKSKSLLTRKMILKTLFDKGLAISYSAEDQDGTILSQSVFTYYGKRITHILGSSNEKGILASSMAFLMDQIIQENAESDYYFDFEGSDVPGVREFFRRFGPEEKKYPQIFWDNTAGIYSFVKKIKSQLNQ